MSSVNKVILIGNLGKDPEVKSFQSGGKIANFSIATSERWKDKNSGDQKERTEWHNILVQSDGLVAVVERFLRKGSKVYVEGKLQTRKWQDRDGIDRYTTEVVLTSYNGTLVMLDGKPDNAGQSRNDDGWGSSGNAASTGAGFGGPTPKSDRRVPDASELDDEVPF